jgi:hypothetical protein
MKLMLVISKLYLSMVPICIVSEHFISVCHQIANRENFRTDRLALVTSAINRAARIRVIGDTP